MSKKLSVVLFASLFSVAFAAGCKKDEKKDEGGGAAAATCDGVAAKISEHMHANGKAEMDKPPEDQKKAMAESMKAIPAAIAKACKDDKWSDEALKCAATAKDPKEDCKDKLSEEQKAHMGEAVKAAMMAGALPAGGTDPGASADGSGTGTGSAVAPTTPPPPADGTAQAFPKTCDGAGANVAVVISTQLPPGVPGDFATRFGAMITTRCTEDKWPQDAIDCAATSADPKKDCRPKLSDEQNAKVDAEQDKMRKDLMDQLAAAGGGGTTGGGSGSSGVAECDELAAAIAKLSTCAKLPAGEKQGFEMMAQGLTSLGTTPDSQKAEVSAQCKAGLTAVQQTATAYGC